MGLTDVEVAIAATQAGAEVVARGYGAEHIRHAKTTVDFATDTDVLAEEAIVAVLAQFRTDDPYTGEELGPTGNAGNPRRWLIDPLCGTLNFAATTPLVSVNVALSESGQVRVAAAADPIAGELFWTDGHQGFRRYQGKDHSLKPSSISKLIDINCDGPTDRAFVGGQLVADPRLRASYGPRVVSSTLAVAWVAAGRRCGYVSDGDFRNNVHFAAGIALCEATGCLVTDLAGDPLHAGRGLIIAADYDTHTAVVEMIRPHLQAVRDASKV